MLHSDEQSGGGECSDPFFFLTIKELMWFLGSYLKILSYTQIQLFSSTLFSVLTVSPGFITLKSIFK